MTLFEGRKFLLLPNCESSTLSFLSQLIKSNGGTVICDVRGLDKQMITLVNRSFIDIDQKLTNKDLFLKEFDLNPGVVWGFIIQERPVCVEAGCVSDWLKTGKIAFDPESIVRIDSSSTPNCAQLISEHPEESKKEDLDHEPSSGSQSETDVGSENSLKDINENTIVKVSCGDEPYGSCVPETGTVPSPVNEEVRPKNDRLIKVLSKLAKRYEIKGDQYRTKGYNLARIGIEKYPYEIYSGEQARRDIASVGSSIAKKIQIILDTGSLPGLEESFDLEKELNYFTQCHHVGIYSAKRWNLLGLQSFTDVSRRFPDVFIKDWQILFGWSYYEDWQMRISRDECEQILTVVRDRLKRIDPLCSLELQGSYVRGARDCGDIDILFFKRNCNSTSELGKIMEKLALALYDEGHVECFLQLSPKIRQAFGYRIKQRLIDCKLKVPSQEEYPPAVDGLKKYFLGFKLRSEFRPTYSATSFDIKLEPNDRFMSLSCASNPCRRVDFFCCKYSELGAARLQWTGPKDFNRWIRIRAAQKGMKLTQHGLYRNGNILLESFDEKRIFELLGEKYVGPADRNSIIKKRQ